jgi:lambda family phage minor tail protein L
MTFTADIQTLAPGAEVILFELDARAITGGGAGDILRFHGYTSSGSIFWQGNQYDPWPIQADGFKVDPAQPSVPTLSVGNVDGRIAALCIAYQDLVGARLTRRRTLKQYLDGQPGADPDQESAPDIWLIERRSSEDNTQVTFELASPMDLGDRQVPSRQIIANVCSWLIKGGYRGPYCGYNGPPVAKQDDSPTSDPSQDVCGGRLSSCRLRFGQNNQLPYGGYPASKLIR